MKQYEFLDEGFLTLMNDIGRYGFKKYGANDFQAGGDRKRKLPRHRKEEILAHAWEHLSYYKSGVLHDHTSGIWIISSRQRVLI